MSKYCFLMLAACALYGCKNQPAQEKPRTAEMPEALSVSHWTGRTELFMEYPPLIAGQTARFAVHLTRLDNFKPLKASSVEIQLASAEGAQSFPTTNTSRPGIFVTDVKPPKPGSYTMSVLLRSSDLNDNHGLGMVTVYADEAGAASRPVEKKQEETIAFLKEQQWSLDFATEIASERAGRASFTVPAEVQPRTGGQGDVTAPIDGRLVDAVAVPIGRTVSRGQIIARIAPPVSAPADLPSLQLAKTEAENALRFATHDRERAQRLVNAGAAPARRLDEARFTETSAEARLKTAEERMVQYETTREAGGDLQARLFAVRAPISGTVTESRAITGGNVRAGDLLLRVVETDRVYVAASVPESEAPRLRQVTGAELQSSNGLVTPVGRLVSIGRVVEARTRTVPVIYEIDNRNHRFAVGEAVTVRLFTSANTLAPAVRESAIVDDAGRPVVYVQIAGEAFARRPVTLGNHQGDYVQIIEGIRPGERVVTKGAYLIRLAAMSNQIPAHGHVH